MAGTAVRATCTTVGTNRSATSAARITPRSALTQGTAGRAVHEGSGAGAPYLVIYRAAIPCTMAPCLSSQGWDMERGTVQWVGEPTDPAPG